MSLRAPKMQYCWNCGEELGVYYQPHGDRDICGKQECYRELRNADQAERDEAHEQLDRDMGWS